MAAWRTLEIRNFSSCVEKIFHSFAALAREIFFNTRRETSYLRAQISSTSDLSQQGPENYKALLNHSGPLSHIEGHSKSQDSRVTKERVHFLWTSAT